MKTNYITANLVSILALLFLFSCAEDKVYDLGGISVGKVSFKAVNLALHDSIVAESTDQDYYYDLPDINRRFHLRVYDLSTIYAGVTSNEIDIENTKKSTIWTGGYCPIQITFTPSVPEEKSATFTMPDGTTHTATAANPTFIWTPDSTLKYRGNLNVEDTYVKAESNYTIGNNTYHNSGYIFLDIQKEYIYDSLGDKWYDWDWLKYNEIPSLTYNKFTVEVSAIQRSTLCTSSNSEFPETIVAGNDTIFIPVKISDEETIKVDQVLRRNEFLACRNSSVVFTFIPQKGETEMDIRLPNGSTVFLSADHPTFEWNLGNNYYSDGRIYGISMYTKDGITYYAESEVYMKFDTGFTFNPHYGAYIP